MRGPVSYYDPDEVEPMVTAAVMYYQAHRSQAQIARHLGVSRSTVSRLLARARQLGIVRIDIVPPTADPGLGKDLQERLAPRHPHRRRAGRPRRPRAGAGWPAQRRARRHRPPPR